MLEDFRPAAYAAMAICAAMVLFNLSKFKKRGWSVLWMSTAFVAFALLLNALINDAPSWQAYLFGTILGSGLVGDAVSKLGRPKETPEP